jgi:hypothetical protein
MSQERKVVRKYQFSNHSAVSSNNNQDQIQAVDPKKIFACQDEEEK